MMVPVLRPALVLVASLLAASVVVADPPLGQHVTLLHTSDLHGSVLAWDDLRDAPAEGSLSRVATVVRRVRAESGHPVLLLDSGDTLQGTPLEEYVHVRWREPSPTVAAMGRLGYAAMAVGNHEFNFGLGPLRAAGRQAAFPFLSANILDSPGGQPAFEPFVLLDAGEVVVGVLGLTTPGVPRWEEPEHIRGLAFEPMDESARRWVPRLREAGADLVVLLAHTGFESGPDDPENFARRLASVPGVDVLLTGHTHRDIPPHEVGATIVSQPAGRARSVTRIDLELERSGDGWRVASWSGENLPTAEVAPDPELERVFAGLHARVREELDETLATAEASVSVARCRLVDCAAVDLIHAAQLEATGADLSLASLLSDRTPDLAPGVVTRRWVHGLYVYRNSLVVVRLSGAQVKDLLEHAARYYDGLECGEQGCTVLTDGGVARYNVDSMAGLDYRIDPTRPEGDRVHDLRRDGRPLDLHRVFTVACNNYRAAGGGGFPHLRDAEVVLRDPRPVDELIADHLLRTGAWTPRSDGNWALAPVVLGERRGGEDRW